MIRSLLGFSLLLGSLSGAYAQTTYINPNGAGGYTIYTPPTIGSGQIGGTTTYINPNGAGGFNAYTPPRIGGGY